MKKIAISFLFILTLTGCSAINSILNKDQSTSAKTTPFRIARLDGISSTSLHPKFISPSSDGIVTFDLGDIKGSVQIAFTISNGGTSDITSVNIGTDNSAFSSIPSKISTLEASTAGKFALSPLLTFNIEHGKRLNGVGTASLLPNGENVSTYRVSGTYNGQIVTMDVRVLVHAQVVRLELFDGGTKIDLSKESGATSGAGYVEYSIQKKSMQEINNTGTVPIKIGMNYQVSLTDNTTKYMDDPTPPTIQPGESFKNTFYSQSYLSSRNLGSDVSSIIGITFTIEANGCQFDKTLLSQRGRQTIQDDGNFRFGL